MVSTNNLYDINPATVSFDERLWDLADELYWGLMFTTFIFEDELPDEDDYDDEKYEGIY